MKIQQIEQFRIIGLAIRTTNENGQSAQDIPALWKRFMEEDIISSIPSRVNDSLYCLYTDYEKDHTRPYTTILGCKVHNLDVIPAGLVGRVFEADSYVLYTASGHIHQGIVINEWVKIWNSDLPRAYHVDFEVYGEKAQDMENAMVDIFVSVR